MGPKGISVCECRTIPGDVAAGSHCSTDDSVISVISLISDSPGSFAQPFQEQRETQSEFTGMESGVNSGDRLDRALRISTDDHKTITKKIRGRIDDTRYHIK